MQNIQIKTTNMELTPAIQEYVTKKISALDKLIQADDDSIHCYVEVGKTTKHHKNGEFFIAEINLKAGGKEVFARSEQEDLYAAIDDVKDEVASELKSLKGRRMAMIKRGGAKIKEMIRGIYSK